MVSHVVRPTALTVVVFVAVFLGLAVFALVLVAAGAAAAFLVVVVLVVVFLAAGAFCSRDEKAQSLESDVLRTLAAAGFFAVVALVVVALALVAGAALGAAAAAGAAPFFASFTGPEGPFGCSKTFFATPDWIAWLTCLLTAASSADPRLLFAATYFLMACRLANISLSA